MGLCLKFCGWRMFLGRRSIHQVRKIGRVHFPHVALFQDFSVLSQIAGERLSSCFFLCKKIIANSMDVKYSSLLW